MVLVSTAAVVLVAVTMAGVRVDHRGEACTVLAPPNGYAADGSPSYRGRFEFHGDVPIVFSESLDPNSVSTSKAQGYALFSGDADNGPRPFEGGAVGGGGGAGGSIRLLDGLTDITAGGDIRIFGTIDSAGGRGGSESYSVVRDLGFATASDVQKSTFAVDVDTAGYSIVRRMINEGRLPPPAAVRVEELVNYFPYAYEGPAGKEPFAVRMEVAACPWNLEHRLVRVALKGREIAKRLRPKMNLVFLVDVSGSMDAPDKLPLVKSSMRMLLDELTEWDSVGIVTYA
jgi:hypothetical protein